MMMVMMMLISRVVDYQQCEAQSECRRGRMGADIMGRTSANRDYSVKCTLGWYDGMLCEGCGVLIVIRRNADNSRSHIRQMCIANCSVPNNRFKCPILLREAINPIEYAQITAAVRGLTQQSAAEYEIHHTVCYAIIVERTYCCTNKVPRHFQSSGPNHNLFSPPRRNRTNIYTLHQRM